MKQKFLSFFFIACALFTWALPAKADDPDWASMGAAVPSIEYGYAQYYVYNIGAGKFLTSSDVTDDPNNAALFNVMGFDTYYNILDGNMTALTLSPMVGDPSSQLILTKQTTSPEAYHYTISISASPYYHQLSVYGGSLFVAMAESTEASANVCEWIFIPKATFEAALAAMSGGGEEEESIQGLYYLYNTTTERYATVARKTVAAADIDQASVFYVKKNDDAETYRISFYDGTNATAQNNVKYVCVYATSWSTTAYNLNFESASGSDIYITQDYNNTKYYLSINNSFTFTKPTTADTNSKWRLIPASDIKEQRIDAWEDESTGDDYVKKKTTVNDEGGFYFLYNPATKTTLVESSYVNFGTARAYPFYIKKDGAGYTFAYEKGENAATVYYVGYGTSNTSWTSITSVTDNARLTLETTGDGYYRIRNSNNMYMTVKKTAATSYSRNSISGATLTGYAYSAEDDVNSYWVLISRADYDIAAPTFPDSDDWVENAVAPTSQGLYYLYNPATQRWLAGGTSIGTNAAANQAGAFYVSYDEGSGKYTIVNANPAYGTTIRYFTGRKAYATDITRFTLTETGIDTKRFYLAENNNSKICYPKTYVSSIASATGLPSNWGLNYAFNEMAYPYTPNGWCEWVFIPYAYHEAQIGEVSSSGESMADGGFAPQVGESYFLYNVEAKTFYGNGSYLVADKTDAQVQ